MSDHERKKDIVRNFFQETWNNANLDYIDEIYPPDFELHALWQNPALIGSTKSGREQAKEVIGRWHESFPGITASVEDAVCEGDIVVCRHWSVATWTRPFRGMEPNGATTGSSGITFQRVVGDKITDAWTLWNALGMMQSLMASQPGSEQPRTEPPDWPVGHPDPGLGRDEMEARLRKLYERAWGQGETELLPELVSPDFCGHAPVALDGARGVDGVAAFVDSFLTAGEGLTVRVEDVRVEGANTGSRFKVGFRHSDTFLGVPATGNEAEMQGMAFTTFGPDGKVLLDWIEVDLVGLYQQLGIIPVDEPEAIAKAKP